MPHLNPVDPVQPLTWDSLMAALERAPNPERARLIGRRIECHRTIGSTNDRARELAAQGEPEGTVIVAEEQTRGRGRADREWHSVPGLGLYLSVILRPSTSPAKAPLAGLMAAVAGCEALARAGGVPVAIKWPNDLVSPGPAQHPSKLAGILVEARTAQDGLRDLVIGMGVNVNHQEGDFPAGLRRPATSLRLLAGSPLDRSLVAAEVLTALDAWYTLWQTQGDGAVLRAFRMLTPDLEGRHVRVSGGEAADPASAEWVGTTAGLTDDGALIVRPDEGGQARQIRYGDVTRIAVD